MNTLADLLSQMPVREDEKRFVDKSLQLSALLTAAMQRQGLSQKELADLLGKRESEISRWLSGLHNFTLKTITKLEAVLGEDLVLTFRDQRMAAVPARAQWHESGSVWQHARGTAPRPQTAPPVEDNNFYSLTAAA